MTQPPKPQPIRLPCTCDDEISEARRQKLIATLIRNLNSAQKIADELLEIEAKRQAA